MADLIIKTRYGKKGLKTFVSRAVRNGKRQKEFAAQARACGARPGMPKSAIPGVGRCIAGKGRGKGKE